MSRALFARIAERRTWLKVFRTAGLRLLELRCRRSSRAAGSVNAMSEDLYRTIRLFRDGTLWCALLGPDLQTGNGGFGATVSEALRDLANRLEAEGWRPGEPHRGLRVVPKPEPE
jgi:hypothetical protein